METIKCKKCGCIMGAASERCPVCGALVNDNEETIVEEGSLQIISEEIPNTQHHSENSTLAEIEKEATDNLDADIKQTDVTLIEADIIEESSHKNRPWIWVLIVVLLCLAGGGGYFFFGQKERGDTEKEESQKSNDIILPDGNFCYTGEWKSSRYTAQPCKVEFTKIDNILLDCSYTNLKYNYQIPLKGTITGDKLHFVGDINDKQLVIDLKVSYNGNNLIGEGIDYAHSSDKAKLFLTEADNSAIDGEKYIQDNQQESSMPAGLTFRTFTKNDKESGNTIQSRLTNETIVSNLKKLGFNLIDRTTESRPDYGGEDYYEVTVETYSKTVNGNVTTVKLESEYTEIHFPNLNDIEEFKKTVRDCGLKETEDGFKDSEDIYWAGTDVSIKGTIVSLNYKFEP